MIVVTVLSASWAPRFRTYSQNMPMVARQMVEKKTVEHLS